MTERIGNSIEKIPASRHQETRGSATKAARRVSNDARHTLVSAEERERMIAVKAYYCAERRGFAPGHEMEDWCEAEAEIDRQLRRG